MKRKTRGRELFREWLEASGLSAYAFAKRTGIDQAAISKLLSGERGPGIDTAATIQLATRGKVPAVAWSERAA